MELTAYGLFPAAEFGSRITSYNVCYTKLLRFTSDDQTGESLAAAVPTRIETMALASVRAAADAVQDQPPRPEPGVALAGEDAYEVWFRARAEATGRHQDWLKVKVAGLV